MRVIFKIFSITLVLFVLFAPSVKAQCACKSQCGPNEELDDLCTDPYKPYYCCRPTATPKPTNPPGGASPTLTPTLPPYCNCINSTSSCIGSTCVFKQKDCFKYNGFSCNTAPNFAVMEAYCNGDRCGTQYICGYSANCSGAQNCNPNNSNCETRNLTLDCNYDASGCNQCGVGRVAAIYCDFDGDGIKENHCGDLCVSNSLCSNNQWCSSSSGNPTNTAVCGPRSAVCLLCPRAFVVRKE